tara:strand:+ start:63 stop:776 length:714 start_codon:yes stop_codon:yes gene_type:complete
MKPEEITKKIKPSVKANKNFSKIFCIGLNKTGTTTLAATLEIYGYSIPNQMNQEMEISKQTYFGNYQPLKEFVNKYDAFQDLPFSIDNYYIVADSLFPNSKFILTERDPEEWYKSLIKYDTKKYNIDNIKNIKEEDLENKFFYLFEDYRKLTMQKYISKVENNKIVYHWNLIYDKETYINYYIQRNDQIKKYFSNRANDLLILDLSKEKNTEKLCNFLNIPIKFKFDFPHLNATKDE